MSSSCIDEGKVDIGKVNHFEIVSVKNEELHCKAKMEIVNKSFLPFNIEASQLYVYSGSRVLGTVKLKEPLKIHGNSKEDYQIMFVVEINNAEASLMSFISSFFGNKPVYKLKGNITARYLFIHKCIDVDKALDN